MGKYTEMEDVVMKDPNVENEKEFDELLAEQSLHPDGPSVSDEAMVDPFEEASLSEVNSDVAEEWDDDEKVAESLDEELENKFEALVELLDSKRYADFMHELEELNPVDAADFFTELPPARIPAVFRLLKKDTAADVFAELDIDVQERIITAMTDREISVIIEELALDDAVDIVGELPANIVQRIMKNATPETRAGINRFLAYPDDSAGSIMTSEFIHLRRDMTCAQAIEHIRRTGLDKETVYVAYVTDSSRVLLGIVPLRQLLFSESDEIIEDIMDPNIICASTMDDRETVASTISKYGMLALPIVDREHRLVGIVTVDDAMDVLETEVTEDIEKMAAIVPSDKPYFKTGIFETWRKRIPWLLLLMLSATFTSMILAGFEQRLDAYDLAVSLTVFVPMLTGTGGNASGQTSATIIRGLSLGEIELRDIFKVLWKELRVSVLCGITVAAACFVKTMLVDYKLHFSPESILSACIVCLTLFCAIVLAKLTASILPIAAKRIGFDPAVMASPFITTIVDTITLLIYFAIATSVLAWA